MYIIKNDFILYIYIMKDLIAIKRDKRLKKE